MAIMQTYCGRFAPTPSGPLHFGSLVAAVASYIRAHAAGGRWHVRIEDIDAPRVVPGAADDIIRTLEAFGLQWDGPVEYQSHNAAAYEAALASLTAQGMTYPCTCSRREIADSSLSGIDGPIYSGICRERVDICDRPAAIRVRTPDRLIQFKDALAGLVRQNLAREIGDFVLRRADGIFNYQLAVVVDDAALGVTEVVRGADLIGSTVRQIYLQQVLGYSTPSYCHVAVVCNERGQKLSKQSLASPVDKANPIPALMAAAAFLGYSTPFHETDDPHQLLSQLASG